jgi:hypothetical protein
MPTATLCPPTTEASTNVEQRRAFELDEQISTESGGGGHNDVKRELSGIFHAITRPGSLKLRVAEYVRIRGCFGRASDHRNLRILTNSATPRPNAQLQRRLSGANPQTFRPRRTSGRSRFLRCRNTGRWTSTTVCLPAGKPANSCSTIFLRDHEPRFEPRRWRRTASAATHNTGSASSMTVANSVWFDVSVAEQCVLVEERTAKRTVKNFPPVQMSFPRIKAGEVIIPRQHALRVPSVGQPTRRPIDREFVECPGLLPPVGRRTHCSLAFLPLARVGHIDRRCNGQGERWLSTASAWYCRTAHSGLRQTIANAPSLKQCLRAQVTST